MAATLAVSRSFHGFRISLPHACGLSMDFRNATRRSILGRAPSRQLGRRDPPGDCRERQAGVESFHFLADYHALARRARLRQAVVLPPIGRTGGARARPAARVRRGQGLLNRAHAYKAAVEKNRAAGAGAIARPFIGKLRRAVGLRRLYGIRDQLAPTLIGQSW